MRRSSNRTDPMALVEEAGPFEPVTVKWFNRLNGYGFLTQGPDSPDIFFHMETIRLAGLSAFMPEQPLSARIASGNTGPLAVGLDAAAAAWDGRCLPTTTLRFRWFSYWRMRARTR